MQLLFVMGFEADLNLLLNSIFRSNILVHYQYVIRSDPILCETMNRVIGAGNGFELMDDFQNRVSFDKKTIRKGLNQAVILLLKSNLTDTAAFEVIIKI